MIEIPTRYTEKFIAFVDILGFAELVKKSEDPIGTGVSPDHLIALTRKLGSDEDCTSLARSGPRVCPQSRYISRDLAFQITQISDCVVASVEISPAGLINLIHHCFGISTELLIAGHLCRGYITKGPIIHTSTQFIGGGYQRAVEGERSVSVFQIDDEDRGTPFVQVEAAVCEYVRTQTDACVNTMFQRMTESDGAQTAISPFRALKNLPSTVIDANFDPRKWKETIGITRANLLRVVADLERTEQDASSRAKSKIAHYKRKLTEVIDIKDKEMATMDRLYSRSR